MVFLWGWAILMSEVPLEGEVTHALNCVRKELPDGGLSGDKSHVGMPE